MPRGLGRGFTQFAEGVGAKEGSVDELGNMISSAFDPFGHFEGPGKIGYTAEEFPVDVAGLTEIPGMADYETQIDRLGGTALGLRNRQEERLGDLQAAQAGAALGDFAGARGAMATSQQRALDPMLQQAGAMGNLATEFGIQASGQGGMSPEELQLRQQGSRLAAQQNAMAAQARGGQAGAALYNAAQQGAGIGAQTNADAMVQRARSIQQARQNQLAAMQGAGGLYGQAEQLGQAGAGIEAGLAQFQAGQRQRGAEFDASRRQEMGLARESLAGQYDQDLMGTNLGLLGSRQQGAALRGGQALGATSLGMEAKYGPQRIEADLAGREYEAKTAEKGGIFGALGGIIGL